MKVLIVDDSTTMRRILTLSLEKMGISDVVEAANGVEAVTSATDDQVSLILMDWNMPEMDGLEAVKTIRSSGNKTPIIMVTTEAEKRRVIEAIQAGINDYVVKPFTPDDIIAKVKKHTA